MPGNLRSQRKILERNLNRRDATGAEISICLSSLRWSRLCGLSSAPYWVAAPLRCVHPWLNMSDVGGQVLPPFGFRISAFSRPSDFGLRISSSSQACSSSAVAGGFPRALHRHDDVVLLLLELENQMHSGNLIGEAEIHRRGGTHKIHRLGTAARPGINVLEIQTRFNLLKKYSHTGHHSSRSTAFCSHSAIRARQLAPWRSHRTYAIEPTRKAAPGNEKS